MRTHRRQVSSIPMIILCKIYYIFLSGYVDRSLNSARKITHKNEFRFHRTCEHPHIIIIKNQMIVVRTDIRNNRARILRVLNLTFSFVQQVRNLPSSCCDFEDVTAACHSQCVILILFLLYFYSGNVSVSVFSSV
jgi:hypothetical protein